jgi:hypothetical protein
MPERTHACKANFVAKMEESLDALLGVVNIVELSKTEPGTLSASRIHVENARILPFAGTR